MKEKYTRICVADASEGILINIIYCELTFIYIFEIWVVWVDVAQQFLLDFNI